MSDMEEALKAIQAVEKNAPSASAARERLMELAVEAKYRADHTGVSPPYRRKT